MSDADRKAWSEDLRNKYGIADPEAAEYTDDPYLAFVAAILDDPQHGE